jgi:hypothetical protein
VSEYAIITPENYEAIRRQLVMTGFNYHYSWVTEKVDGSEVIEQLSHSIVVSRVSRRAWIFELEDAQSKIVLGKVCVFRSLLHWLVWRMEDDASTQLYEDSRHATWSAALDDALASLSSLT